MPGEEGALGAGNDPCESRAAPVHPPLPEYPSSPPDDGRADDDDDDDYSARRVNNLAEAVFIIRDAFQQSRGPLSYHSRNRRFVRRTGGGGQPWASVRRALATLPGSLVRADLRSWASTGVAKGLTALQIKQLIRTKERQLTERARSVVPADPSPATSEADDSSDSEEQAQSGSPTYSPSSTTSSSSGAAAGLGEVSPGWSEAREAAFAALDAAAEVASIGERVRLGFWRATQLRADVASAARQAAVAARAAEFAAVLSSVVPWFARYYRFRLAARRRRLEKSFCVLLLAGVQGLTRQRRCTDEEETRRGLLIDWGHVRSLHRSLADRALRLGARFGLKELPPLPPPTQPAPPRLPRREERGPRDRRSWRPPGGQPDRRARGAGLSRRRALDSRPGERPEPARKRSQPGGQPEHGRRPPSDQLKRRAPQPERAHKRQRPSKPAGRVQRPQRTKGWGVLPRRKQ